MMAHRFSAYGLRPLAIALCAGAFCYGPPASADSIRQVVSDAVAYHPDVKTLQANRSAINEELNAARGLALPGVRLEGRYGVAADEEGSQGTGEVSLKLRQPLYDGGRYRSETSRQTSRLSSANSRVDDTVNTIALQAVQAYLEVVRARRVAYKAQQNRQVIADIVSRVSRRAAGGGANEADVQQVQARLFAARNSVAVAQVQVADAVDLFITAVGRRPGRLRQDKLPTHALPKSLNRVIKLAQDASPKLIAIRHDADAAAAAVGTARSVLRPQVDLELSANHRGEVTELRSRSTGTDDLRAMVVLSMSLYNGGIDRARVREAEFRALEAEAQVGSAGLTVERELRLAWNAWRGSGQKVGNLSSQAKANARLAQLRLEQYDSGLATLVSILDAQNEAFVSGVQATNEYNAGRFSFYKLLAASGRLAEFYNLNAPVLR